MIGIETVGAIVCGSIVGYLANSKLTCHWDCRREIDRLMFLNRINDSKIESYTKLLDPKNWDLNFDSLYKTIKDLEQENSSLKKEFVAYYNKSKEEMAEKVEGKE